MSDRYLDNLLPDFGEYSLESVLDDYRKRTDVSAAETQPAPAPAKTAESIAQRSRQIVMDALGDTLSQYRPELQFEPGPGPEPEPKLEFEIEPELELEPEPKPELKLELEPKPTSDEPLEPAAPAKKPKRPIHISPDGIITISMDASRDEPEEAATPAPSDEPEEAPSPAPDTAEEEPAPAKRRRREPRVRRSYTVQDTPGPAERFLLPLIRLIATSLARKQMQKAEAANWPDPVDIRETEELSPKRGAKFYSLQLKPLRFRCRVCFFMCVVLAWIGLDLPMAGILGRSITVQAGVSLILLMAVMIATLDILATGIRQLLELHPGGEALATLSALLACVDGVMVMMGYGDYLPFCAAGGVSLATALWGEQLSCKARARTLRTAAMSRTPSAVAADDNERYLLRTQQNITGIVRRTEQPDFCQNVYTAAAPLFLLASLGLAILASTGGQGGYFLHTLSALLAVSASFTAFLSFPLPYAMTARKLQASGAAIVGYAGCADIGRTKRVVIADNDLFPPGTMKLTGINIQEGVFVDKVISCTTSLLAAAGSGVTGVFLELVTRRGYSTVQADEFKCHEGGGLSARVAGEHILVGSPGFMNLMGIRLPQNMNTKNAICTAISGDLVGVFTLEYIPVTSVQEALVTLLQGRTQPIFAIRDFNITPLMIRQLFRMPTDNFNFPTFRERYRITSAAASDSPISAVISRTGMGPMVDAAECGRKLYNTCRISTIISLVGTAVGLLTMFLLCRAGAYETATAGNVLSYMALWALPVIILSVGQSR